MSLQFLFEALQFSKTAFKPQKRILFYSQKMVAYKSVKWNTKQITLNLISFFLECFWRNAFRSLEYSIEITWAIKPNRIANFRYRLDCPFSQ